MANESRMPRDVLAMLHLLSRWLQCERIEELRIAPGSAGSDEAKLTRIIRVADSNTVPTPPVKRAPAKRYIGFAEPRLEATLRTTVELLPLSRSGGLSGLNYIRLTKRCPRCRKKKFIEEFNRTAAASDGRNAYCRECKSDIVRKHREVAKVRPDLTAESRFWPKVNKTADGGCWLWESAVTADGYGHFAYQGQSSAPAHLVACALLGRPKPKGMRAHHKCGIRRCVNPDHIVFASYRDISLVYAKDNPFKRNAEKRQCINHHPFTKQNTHYFRVGKHPPTRVCLDCLKARNPGTRKHANKPSDAVTPKAGKLMTKMEGHIAALPPQIREDARSILLVEILAGAVADLDAAVKRAVREAWKYQPSRWAVPLDAPIADGSDTSLIDMIPDPSAASDPALARELSEVE